MDSFSLAATGAPGALLALRGNPPRLRSACGACWAELAGEGQADLVEAKARMRGQMSMQLMTNVGKSTAQLEQEFRAAAPAWVIDTETRELWKAQLKSAGDLVAVRPAR